MPSPPHLRLRNRDSLPRAVSNGAHPSDYAARELWTAIPCDSLECRRVILTSESPTIRQVNAYWPSRPITGQCWMNIRLVHARMVSALEVRFDFSDRKT